MIRLLSVSGSPAANASTDHLLGQIGETLLGELGPDLPAEQTFIKLNELKYIPCQACGRSPEPDWCLFDDDLSRVYRLLAECDCLLFGSPVYFDSVSGQAKMFIDRCNCFRPFDFAGRQKEHRFVKRLEQKRPGAIVLVGGDDIGFESARRTIAGFFKWIEVTNCGVIRHISPDDRAAGTARTDDVALRAARETGQKLAQILREKHERQRNG